MFLMLSLKALSVSSDRLLTAGLDVCSRDTITAEYDVVRNRDSTRVKRKTIRDDKLSGDRDVPTVRGTLCYTVRGTLCYTVS
jgi:hypothetical protein